MCVSYLFLSCMHCCHRFDVVGLVRALAMINAIEVMNKSPLLTDVNITLGYKILDSCSDVNTAMRATEDIIEQANCHTGSNTTTCSQPVMAVVGSSISEISIAIARQLTLKMIPQVSCEKRENTLDSVMGNVGIQLL